MEPLAQPLGTLSITIENGNWVAQTSAGTRYNLAGNNLAEQLNSIRTLGQALQQGPQAIIDHAPGIFEIGNNAPNEVYSALFETTNTLRVGGNTVFTSITGTLATSSDAGQFQGTGDTLTKAAADLQAIAESGPRIQGRPRGGVSQSSIKGPQTDPGPEQPVRSAGEVASEPSGEHSSSSGTAGTDNSIYGEGTENDEASVNLEAEIFDNDPDLDDPSQPSAQSNSSSVEGEDEDEDENSESDESSVDQIIEDAAS